jgi:hypothetical protein
MPQIADDHGIGAALMFPAAVCALVFRAQLREKPRLLDATLSELNKDVAAIRSHQ